jgi:Zn-dependent M28 family amino/carboxypeptidase
VVRIASRYEEPAMEKDRRIPSRQRTPLNRPPRPLRAPAAQRPLPRWALGAAAALAVGLAAMTATPASTAGTAGTAGTANTASTAMTTAGPAAAPAGAPVGGAATATPPGHGASPGGAANDLEAGRRWWAHIRYLADDRLEGRLTGSAGYRQAAAYVAEHFKEYGLQPAGTDGYFQPVHFAVQRVVAAQTSVALVRDGREEPLDLGKDALVSSRAPAPRTLEAPLVFAGYALHLPEAGYDDMAGIDLKGKVIVFINGGPASISGALKAHAHAGRQLYRALEEAGVAGTITIPNPRSMDIPWERMSKTGSQSGMWIDEADLRDMHGTLFSATFNPAHADRLFAGSGHTLAELLALVDAGKPLPRFPLAVAVRARVATTTEKVEAPNVAGILRGTDPKLAAEVVVLSAHLDHLGIGEPIRGDSIYNGAMDNASGVASLLEIARALHDSGARPRRSLLFLAVCGEEKGLLGSRYFAAHPTVPPRDLAADLNFDMFLPLYPLRLLTVEGIDESSLGGDARAVAAAAGVEAVADDHPERNLFVRSDQYNFIREGVPSLAFAFGAAPGSPEERMQKDWLTNRYHAPSDDTDQPVDLAAAAKFNRIMLAIALRVADDDARPAWNQDSFFRRFAGP